MPRGVYKRKPKQQKEPDLKKLILKAAKHHKQLYLHLSKIARSL